MADPYQFPVRRSPSTGSATHRASSQSDDRSQSPNTRDSSLRLSHMPSPAASHRQSFSGSLRSHPSSPRAQRQPSLSQAAVQELLKNPPVAHTGDPAFTGRDWRTVKVGEIVSKNDVHFVELDTGVETATNLLIESGAPVILIRRTSEEQSAVGTFDYSDLNAYLLLVVGLARPEEDQIESFQELAKNAREGNKIPVKDVKDLGKKEPLVTLSSTESLTKAVEIFGSGVHRIGIVEEGTTNIIGILSQLKLVKFLWQNTGSFPVIDQLSQQYLKDLGIGSKQVIGINGDRKLTDALELMNNEGITSVAVVDAQLNVIGNISTVDVKVSHPRCRAPPNVYHTNAIFFSF
ncbi:MAG: hypothetical protein M1819_003080 [Sarea resinae]|nr:MAG: hypothetical protein M1819_003080 [Sarea resinae]